MSATSTRIKTKSDGPDATERIGRRLAEVLPGGSAVGLVGPLGAGKTCFVRGLAAGLGVDPDVVASPTFVYLVDYERPEARQRRPGSARPALHHADLYRLDGVAAEAAAEVFAGIGLYAALGGDEITVVEWWDHYQGPEPERLVVVEFVVETANDRAILLEFVGPELADATRAFGG